MPARNTIHFNIFNQHNHRLPGRRNPDTLDQIINNNLPNLKHLLLIPILFLATSVLLGQDSTAPGLPKRDTNLYEITELTKKATSEKYGLTGEMPVKVGTGSRGGPFNQRAYLELLRDVHGNLVAYKRVGGGCCPYKSANALIGDYALVDTYEVTYKDEKGEKRKAIIYISFYDYEEPLIPIGFKSSSVQ